MILYVFFSYCYKIFSNTVNSFSFPKLSLDFCEKGYIYKNNRCMVCSPGEFAKEGASVCSKCPAGKTTVTNLPSSLNDCGLYS